MGSGSRPWDPGLPESSGLMNRSNQTNSTHVSSTPSKKQELWPSNESQSRSTSQPLSSTSVSPNHGFHKHQLQFQGAKPVRSGKEWICSFRCKKKNQVNTFRDGQAAEKHIM